MDDREICPECGARSPGKFSIRMRGMEPGFWHCPNNHTWTNIDEGHFAWEAIQQAMKEAREMGFIDPDSLPDT